ncbi:MAG TPA: glycine zipper family protein [Geobacteraceae bacterium]|nr:glycine zipper family protein [Geobacteraceae bacterium]
MNNGLNKIISCLALLLMAGCATLPSGPSVRVLPGDGKSFEQFQTDDAVCRQWSAQSIGMSPQEVANQNTVSGAAVGTVLGAGLGAAIGAAAGNPAMGAAIGAGSGLMLGTASGAQSGQVYGMEAQRRYDNTYIQCMYAKGNQVPGVVRYRTRRTAPPPPDLSSVPPDYVPDNAPPMHYSQPH